MAFVICLLCCSCNNNDNGNTVNNTAESTTEESTKFIESLHFEVNEIVANSKPEDLYVQIGDVYFSPNEALTVGEFINRANKSIMELTYKICEDDIKDVFIDYNPDYLVPGNETLEVFFYCDGQLVFDINVINFSNNTTAIKDCYAFTMNEKHELFSADAVDTKGISWYFQGTSFDGGEHTFASVKSLFEQYGLKYEEGSGKDVLKISAKLNKIEIKFKHQNGMVSFYPYYIAEIDQNTGKVISFYYSITGYNKGTYTPKEITTKKISSTTSTTQKTETTTKKHSSSTHSTYVKPNANLTWEEAYHDNGDGTFTITYVSGEVKTYAPHLVNEGEYVVYDESYENSAGEIGFTIEGWKNLWNMQWCERCHRLTADYGTGEDVCISYIRDTNCHYCGEWVTAHSCHSCKK